MRSVIDRTSCGEGFAHRMAQDALGVAGEEGYRASPADVLRLLGEDDLGQPVGEFLAARLLRVGLGKWL